MQFLNASSTSIIRSYALVLSLVVTTTANAQFLSATVSIDGLTCSMCTLGVQRSMEKLDFVASVNVDLNQNVARVEFSVDRPVNIAAVIKSVKDAGFSVRNLRAELSQSEPLPADPYLVLGNEIFFIIREAGGERNEIHELTFIDEKFTDSKLYKKHRSDIQRILKTLPDDKTPYYFVGI